MICLGCTVSRYMPDVSHLTLACQGERSEGRGLEAQTESVLLAPCHAVSSPQFHADAGCVEGTTPRPLRRKTLTGDCCEPLCTQLVERGRREREQASATPPFPTLPPTPMRARCTPCSPRCFGCKSCTAARAPAAREFRESQPRASLVCPASTMGHGLGPR